MSQATMEAPSKNANETVMEDVLSALHDQSQPMTASQLHKLLPSSFLVSKDELAELLEEAVRAGRVYKFQPYKSSGDRYWDRDKETYARQVIRRSLDEKELSKKGLWTSVKNELRDCNQREVWAILDSLVKEGYVDILPSRPRSSTKHFSANPPDPQNYVRYAINQIGKQWERLASAGVKKDNMVDAVLRGIRETLELQDDQALARAATQQDDFVKGDESAKEFAPAPTTQQLTDTVVEIFEEFLRERHQMTGQVPIHEIRTEVARRYGDESATHAVLDPIIRSLRDRGFRLSPISNTQHATREQIDASIQGMHEILFYLEVEK